MPPPVWVLSVDLQTKTATFVTGMGDAAKGARSAFSEIKQGAGEMANETGYKMMEARHGVMLLGEEFGVHLPRALTSFIASVGPIGAAMEAAFPFLAIAVGATLLIEHLVKMREEGEKLTENQTKFLTATNNAFNALDQKILAAGIRTDELNKDHLAALRKQLEMIDRQSMDELVHSFETVSKAADTVFAEMKTNWYSMGIGSEGAQHALTKFKSEYESLLARGKSTEAGDLLAGTLKTAERIREAQKSFVQDAYTGAGKKSQADQDEAMARYERARLDLKQAGVGVTEKELQSQDALVDTLRAQVEVEQKVHDLKTSQSGNASRTTENAMLAESSKRLMKQLQMEHAGQEEEDKIAEERRNAAIANLQEGEREKIEATEKGTAARLAAIDAAIKQENTKGLQETAFYRQLFVQRVETVRAMAAEEAKIREEAGKLEAEHTLKMGEDQLAALREQTKLENSMHRVSAKEIVEQDILFSDEEYVLKLNAFAREMAALDRHAKDYENKLKAIQNKQSELTRQHETQITQIKERAEIERNNKIKAAEDQLDASLARGLSGVIMRHQSFAAMMSSIGDQIASGMLETAIKSALAMDFGKEKDAAHAARKAFIAGMDMGGIAGMILAPIMAAGAFASVMAFEDGGTVPGVGSGDTVPAMLTPGEHVADKDLTNGLRNLVRNGGGQTHHTHNHFESHVTSLGTPEHLEKMVKRTLDGHLREMSRKKGLGHI